MNRHEHYLTSEDLAVEVTHLLTVTSEVEASASKGQRKAARREHGDLMQRAVATALLAQTHATLSTAPPFET
jgi:hypothetical protein